MQMTRRTDYQYTRTTNRQILPWNPFLPYLNYPRGRTKGLRRLQDKTTNWKQN